MNNGTDRESVFDSAILRKGTVSHRPVATVRSDRDPAKSLSRLRKRAESRVEKELDDFWENVPL